MLDLPRWCEFVFATGSCGECSVHPLVAPSPRFSGVPLQENTSHKVWRLSGDRSLESQGSGANGTSAEVMTFQSPRYSRSPLLREEFRMLPILFQYTVQLISSHIYPFCGRSQHLVLLLADWMSAIMLQAIFYGKSQFGVREKVGRHRLHRCSTPTLLQALHASARTYGRLAPLLDALKTHGSYRHTSPFRVGRVLPQRTRNTRETWATCPDLNLCTQLKRLKCTIRYFLPHAGGNDGGERAVHVTDGAGFSRPSQGC